MAKNTKQLSTNTATGNSKVAKKESTWDGHLIQLIGWRILGFFVTLCTIGICYPFVLCWIEGWYCKHRVIEGHRMHFDGNGAQLIGNWIKWLLLSIITLSIYAFFIPMKLEAWKTKHMHLVD